MDRICKSKAHDSRLVLTKFDEKCLRVADLSLQVIMEPMGSPGRRGRWLVVICEKPAHTEINIDYCRITCTLKKMYI